MRIELEDPEEYTLDGWLPIIIMSSSSAEKDVLASYNLHANCYVTKPLDLDDFIAAVRKIEDFWIALVKLPAA